MHTASPILKPVIVGRWQVLFRPEKFGSYVNDHTILRAHDGLWHLYGCTQLGPTNSPEMERYFCHAAGKTLMEPMAELNPVIDHGTRAWAPGAIRCESEYFMYYGPSPTRMAHSIDCNHWMGTDIAMIGCPIDAAHRDHMIVKLNDDTWLMYVVGIRQGFGCVSVHVSNDLINWRFVQYALLTSGNAPLRCAWGAIESPYVVRYEGRWYLFVTYTDCSNATYQQTLVFQSTNPYDFGTYTGDNAAEMVVARLEAHAPEILFDDATGNWYATTCGWRGKGVPNDGTVSIARVEWTVGARQQGDTSISGQG